MGARRKAREMAMQALFFMDLRGDFSAEGLGRFCANFAPKPEVRPFFLRLVHGVLRTQVELDALIERFSENWRLDRMSAVDRNVMRIAVYEMICCGDIPHTVSINEAVDIGKKYGTEESGAFINGVVDGIRRALETDRLQLPCGEETVDAAALEPPAPAPAPEAPPAEAPPAAGGTAPLVKRKRKTPPPSEASDDH